MNDMANGIDAHIGAQMERARSRNLLSQAELGKILDMTGEEIDRFEKGERRIVAGMLLGLSDALNVPIAYFFEGLQSAASEEQTKNWPCASPEESRDLIQAFIQITNQETRDSIRLMVRHCAEEA